MVGELLLQNYPSDNSIITFGAREAMALAISSVVSDGDIVVIDENRHYSAILAIEQAGATFVEAKSSGYPKYLVTPSSFENTLEELQEKGRKASLILLTHVDGNWGNLTDAEAIGKLAQKHGIPFLLNAAYSAGRFEFDPQQYGADFVAVSGHKSFGSPGPIGALLYSEKWHSKIIKPSPSYPNKNLNTLGCTVRGVAAPAFYKALVELPDRLSLWENEVAKTRRFVDEMERIGKGGIKQLGERPKLHDVVYFETPVLFEIGETKRKKGYFLAEALAKRGIEGVKEGKTKGFKASVYGLNDQEIDHVINSFEEIINER